MLMDVMFVLLACLARTQDAPAATGMDRVVAELSRAGESAGSVVALGAGHLAFVPSAPFAPGGGGTPEQVLTTTIRDADHPEEPWVVTTYRLPDESEVAFIKRHRDMVEAVRTALE